MITTLLMFGLIAHAAFREPEAVASAESSGRGWIPLVFGKPRFGIARSHRPIDGGHQLAAPSLLQLGNADRNDGRRNPTGAGLKRRADAHPLATGRKIHVDAADPIGHGRAS